MKPGKVGGAWPRIVAGDDGDLWGVGDDGDQVRDNDDHDDCHDDEDEHNIIVNINLDWKGLHFPTQSPKPKLILQ